MGGKRAARIARTFGAVFLAAVVAAACSSGGGGSSGNDTVRLTVGTFGDFGYRPLYQKYMQQHPNVTIVEHVAEYNTHHQTLQTRLAAGTGADDIVAIVFLGFGLFPLAYTFYVSLNHWELGASTHQWVGFHNYTQLLADPYFWNALRNTGSIWVLSTVPQLFLALVLAHVLNRRLRFRTVFRVGVLMPNVASVVAVSIVFAQLFGRDFGLVNWLLHFTGVGPIDWQVGRWSSHPAISSLIIWRWTGWNALLYLAALQAVPRELYEAC